MKILHLVQKPQLRGAEIFAAQQSMHMSSLGHKALLVFIYPGSSDFPFNGTTYHLNGVQARRLRDISAWKRLAAIIKKENPDVIQANAGDTLKYAVMSKLVFRWKQPIVFRNASTISLYIKSATARKFNNFFFKYADKIISVSNTSASDFAVLFPEFKAKITTIPIGIENINYDPMGQPAIVEKYRNSGPVLLHVGGFSFEKNHVGLIRIFEKILKIQPVATLHLVGNGPLKCEIEQLVKEKGLEESVKFYGFQKNALQFMQCADVLLLPSVIEGLPGVILESFFCKTPVVAYDVGGIKEVVFNNRTGRLIHDGDEEAFADGVVHALSKSQMNERMIDNAYRLVTAQYMNARIAKDFLNVYNNLILQKRSLHLAR